MAEDLITQLHKLKAEAKSLPPIHLWKPQRVYDLDMRIDAEGRWFHEGSEIKRKGLVQLFASVLLKEGEDYFLVTPIEKARIQVEDVPFLVVEYQHSGNDLIFRTNLDDLIELSREQPIELRQNQLGELPYIKVRDELWARFNRNVYYQLIEEAQERESGLYLQSHNLEFLLGRI